MHVQVGMCRYNVGIWYVQVEVCMCSYVGMYMGTSSCVWLV